VSITTGGANKSEPAVAYDGSNYMVVWGDDRNGNYDIFAQRVTPEGLPLDGTTGIDILPIPPSDESDPALAFGNDTYLLIWLESNGIYAIRVSRDAQLVGSAFPVCTAAGTREGLSVAFDGESYLVVWQDRRAGNDDVYGTWYSIPTASRSPTLRGTKAPPASPPVGSAISS
jgi:hypothetical protein